jgi:hypothetical protein
MVCWGGVVSVPDVLSRMADGSVGNTNVNLSFSHSGSTSSDLSAMRLPGIERLEP